MQRKLHLVIGVKRLEGCGIRRVVNWVKPDFLFDRRVKHGRVIGGVDRAKTGRERADALIAIDLDFKNFYRQRIARLRAIDEKRPSQRIVSGSHAKSVAWLLDGVAEAIHRVGLKDVSGLQMRDRTV